MQMADQAGFTEQQLMESIDTLQPLPVFAGTSQAGPLQVIPFQARPSAIGTITGFSGARAAMPTAVTGAPSGISLAGINVFDVVGIPPLSAIMAPVRPQVEEHIEPMEIPDSKFDMHRHIKLLEKEDPKRFISEVNMTKKDYKGPREALVMVNRSELTAERMQELRDQEEMGPNPTLPALLRQSATKLAKEHGKGKTALPDPHVAFDHAVFTMLQG